MTHPLGRAVLLNVPDACAYGRLVRCARSSVLWNTEHYFIDDPVILSYNVVFDRPMRWLTRLAQEELR